MSPICEKRQNLNAPLISERNLKKSIVYAVLSSPSRTQRHPFPLSAFARRLCSHAATTNIKEPELPIQPEDITGILVVNSFQSHEINEFFKNTYIKSTTRKI